MLDQVREYGIKIPEPSPEEKETLDKLREFSEDMKKKIKVYGWTDSDTSGIESTRFTPESTMTDGTPESTMEVASIPINTVITCPLDDPNPEDICDFTNIL